MSWLNLNNIKVQITSFAGNVLADQGADSNNDDKELNKKLKQQELEAKNNGSSNEKHLGEKNCNWETHQDGTISRDDVVSRLQKKVTELEEENKYLLAQLEQLDLESQQNLAKVVEIKDKLQEENNELQGQIDMMKQEKLEMKSRNEKLSNTEESYKEKHETALQVNQRLKADQENLKKELNDQKKSNITLQKNLKQSKLNLCQESIKHLEVENRVAYSDAKDDIRREEKSFDDNITSTKLGSKLDAYKEQIVILKEKLLQYERNENENTDLNTRNEQLIKKLKIELARNQEDHLKEINLLKSEMEHIKFWKNNNLQLVNEKLLADNIQKAKQLEVFNENRDSLEKLDKSKSENSHLQFNCQINKEDLENLKQELESLQKSQEHVLLELHKEYVNIITENIKKYQDCEKPSDFQHCCYENSPQLSEFSKQVENIFKILLDFKCKCEMLEQQIYDLSEENMKIISEKNKEIEKLIHNSEILSREVITKTQTIKDYEHECNELAKNNELLINELDNYKNNSGLQTISESNEDNILLLEAQLENANKRIEDLEKIADDLMSQQKPVLDIETDRLDETFQALNSVDTEIIKKQIHYHDLLNSFDQLQKECSSIKSDITVAREDPKYANERNEKLKSNSEKVETEYENTRYQQSKGNIKEVDTYKKQVELLEKENDKLQALNADLSKDYADIQTEIQVLREKSLKDENANNKLEIQIKTLTEKLQNAKMTETSLKLQYDTLTKEVIALSQAKHNNESSLQKVTAELKQFENSYEELQKQNIKLIEDYKEIKSEKMQREKQIIYLENLVGDLQNKLLKCEKLALDENGDIRKFALEYNYANKDLAEYKSLATDGKRQRCKNLSLSEPNVSNNMQVDMKENSKEFMKIMQQYDALSLDRNNLQKQLNKLQNELQRSLEQQAALQLQLQELTNSRNELMNTVTTKHQENITYHNELLRISQILNMETKKCKDLELELIQLKSNSKPDDDNEKRGELEKLIDENHFLKEKCIIIGKNLLEDQKKVQQLLEEKSIPSEKEIVLQKKVNRLQAHLIELEEHYTQELLEAEQKNSKLKEKLNEIEEREKSSSTMYTSISIRSNQQVESLHSQLQAVTSERDELRNKISDAEDLNNKQVAALTNLQFVLEQFQKDKEKDILKETERIRRQINVERQIQDDLKREIVSLKSQLEESKQGLQAASRLSDQLELTKKRVSTLKVEVSQLQDKLATSEENLKKASSQTDGKVDKSLIKNLVIGFVSSNNNLNKDQKQILKVIATVLDFNQHDHNKVKLNIPQQGSSLGSFLSPHSGNQNITQESLSQAFIKFLESESKPRVVPSLLNATTSQTEKSEPSSKCTISQQSPIVLNEIILPTFAGFPQSRNSSSILKDVLKSNNNT